RGNAGVAMAATRALVRRGAKRLNLVAVPTSGIQADLLIGSGCVESIEAAGVSLGELGPAPRFAAAVRAGEILVKDTTCPASHAARATVVTVETLHEQNLLEDPVLAAGTLAGFYVEKVAIAPRGAWPLALPGHYARDEAHLAEYARLAASAEGFARYLDLYVHERRAA